MPEPVAMLENVRLVLDRKTILDGVSLALHPGEIVALIGPGGSGKTQLIRVLCSLAHARSGTVRLFGNTVERLNSRSLREIRKHIGLQFQNFALFDYLDVWHNVAFSLQHSRKAEESEVASEVDQALQRVGLADTGHLYPEELSGGMRRRVAIARVMAARPEIAVFDDPVAGLDPINSAKIMSLLQTFGRSTGCLAVVATHDLHRLFSIADRVIAVFGGLILYDGPTSGALQAPDPQVRRFIEAGMEE